MENGNRPRVGLPRAMLYYRYSVLWKEFFGALGLETAVSGPTSRATLAEGSRLAPDETCLSVKIFLGHVRELIGQCDYILIPRIVNFGRQRSMCVRFASLYDVASNIFRDTGQQFLAYDINVTENVDERTAFLTMGKALGFAPKEVKKAYVSAKKADEAAWKERVKGEERRLQEPGVKILLAGHSYVLEDPYIGKIIPACLKTMGVVPVRADIVDRDAALKKSRELSPTCKWEFSREILGGIVQRLEQVDGIIIVSAFPCGPDAMVDDILLRRLRDKPVLSLVLDGQSGTAGVETRLESFIDIIRFKEGSL